jgi:hypothetical protein
VVSESDTVVEPHAVVVHARYHESCLRTVLTPEENSSHKESRGIRASGLDSIHRRCRALDAVRCDGEVVAEWRTSYLVGFRTNEVEQNSLSEGGPILRRDCSKI